MLGPLSTDATSLLQRKLSSMPSPRNLHQMLQASQHQVKAMERMLEEVDSNEVDVLPKTCPSNNFMFFSITSIGGNLK
jgi:hypothetical protein